MANLACLLKKTGYLVSGSDLDTFGPSAVLLKKHEIKYFKDHDSSHIQKFKPGMVVIGNAIQRGNPSLEYVLNNQLPYCSMPEIIKTKLLQNKKPIVVAGTSGKTTTTALVAWILQKAGLKPTALVGGVVKNLDSGFLYGNGPYAVIEGDEYNSSFYDSSPKFLHYKPYYSIITNIQSDHLDIYGNIENIFKAFQKLVRITPEKGVLILNKSNLYTTTLTQEARSKIITFGKNGNVWANGTKLTPTGLSFIAYSNAKRLGEIKSRLFGKHNIENILTAVAISLELKIPFEKIVQAMADFQGIRRRLEIIHQKGKITIIDDFAHNPEKVLASLSALRSHFPKHKIVAVFEPRTGSSRRKFFQHVYPSSFKPADLVYISEPYKKSALSKKDVFSNRKLVKDLNKKGTESYALRDADHIVTHLKKDFAQKSKKPIIIVVMTSGDFDGIHQRLIELLDK